MPQFKILAFVFLVLVILIISGTQPAWNGHGTPLLGCVAAEAQTGAQWREADPVRVIIDSTADWGRIMFDDLNGTNTNGIGIRSVLGSGWLVGKDDDDVLDAGRKMAWPDTEYNRSITRRGDMVAFFKGLRDFHYTEAYADLVLDVDMSLPQIYVWLMVGGNGTTTFDIVSKSTGGTIWRDVIVGNGETQQVRRVMTPQPFIRTGRSESAVVVAWLSLATITIIILNFPILEVPGKRLAKRRKARSPHRGDGEAEG
jgi:hypothetical protein